MTAEFKEKKINRVIVEGNGESIYYALSEEEKTAMGVNRIICSNITIRFKEGKVNNVKFLCAARSPIHSTPRNQRRGYQT